MPSWFWYMVGGLLIGGAWPMFVYVTVKLGTFGFLRARDLYQKEYGSLQGEGQPNGLK